jgi:hypothetical protein
MKTYWSIDGPSKAPRQSCYSFVKYDGSNIRAEWSKKRGWYKFGTRKCMIDSSDPIFGRACTLFKEKYDDDLAKVFKSEKMFQGVQSVVAFAEFFGSRSFAGMHFPDDPQWDCVLFDLNLHKKGMLGPKEFIDTVGHLKVAELVCHCNLGEELIQDVRKERIDCNSKYDIKPEIPEGVVCKGGKGHDLWMCKIKTERYKAELKKRYEVDWVKLWGVDEDNY